MPVSVSKQISGRAPPAAEDHHGGPGSVVAHDLREPLGQIGTDGIGFATMPCSAAAL